MANLLEEIASYLQLNNIGTIGTDIFIGFEPAGSINAIVIIPITGYPPSPKRDKEYPGVQVLVKDKSAKNGLAKAEQIYKLLHKNDKIIDSIHGRCFVTDSAPVYIGRGVNGEMLYVVNSIWYIGQQTV